MDRPLTPWHSFEIAKINVTLYRCNADSHSISHLKIYCTSNKYVYPEIGCRTGIWAKYKICHPAFNFKKINRNSSRFQCFIMVSRKTRRVSKVNKGGQLPEVGFD